MSIPKLLLRKQKQTHKPFTPRTAQKWSIEKVYNNKKLFQSISKHAKNNHCEEITNCIKDIVKACKISKKSELKKRVKTIHKRYFVISNNDDLYESQKIKNHSINVAYNTYKKAESLLNISDKKKLNIGLQDLLLTIEQESGSIWTILVNDYKKHIKN